MKLQPYEILSHVIPGFIIYAFLLILFPKNIPNFEALPSVAIAFFIGYYVNMLSSLLENFYFILFGGKPSSQILKKDMGKIKLYQREKIIEFLKKDLKNQNASKDEMFSVAMRVANNSTNDRIKDFNSSYALSRAMLTCVFIVGIFSLIQFYKIYWVWFILATLLLASTYRAKQRGYYYAKEVLGTYLVEKENLV